MITAFFLLHYDMDEWMMIGNNYTQREKEKQQKSKKKSNMKRQDIHMWMGHGYVK